MASMCGDGGVVLTIGFLHREIPFPIRVTNHHCAIHVHIRGVYYLVSFVLVKQSNISENNSGNEWRACVVTVEWC